MPKKLFAFFCCLISSMFYGAVDDLVAQICNAGGCTPAGVESMSDEEFFK